MLNEDNILDFIGNIIDIFEDFLTERDIVPFNDEPQEDNDPPVYIYGADYFEIEDKIKETLKNWEMYSNADET